MAPNSRTSAAGGARRRDAAVLIGLLVACLGAGALGSIFTASRIEGWYAELRKPAFTPPSWLFGPVWTVLYCAMAVAAWLVWRRRDLPAVRRALGAFAVQLLLNASWSPLFFGLRSPSMAFAVIVLLWVAVLVTAGLFFRISAAGGWLMVPYALWVTFAAVLNLSIWRLNA